MNMTVIHNNNRILQGKGVGHVAGNETFDGSVEGLGVEGPFHNIIV